MKKSLSIILSLAMVCTMSATAFAADSSTDLSAIADATIQVTQTTSESGAITNTFNNLDDFVNAVHTANPAISDYEIATYERFIPVMHFVPISPRCDYCTGGARDYYFSAYIRYGMIADESVNIQAGYAHKTIGFGDISVGIDVNGTPSFSASVATVVPYVARAVTVTY